MKLASVLAIALVLTTAANTTHAVTVIETGHTDISISYDDIGATWDLGIHLDDTDEDFAANDAVLRAKAGSRTTVPSDPRFSFLGMAGDPIWNLPMVQDESLLFLGYGGDDIPTGIFNDDTVRITLKGFTGPGSFYSYKVDGFGNPTVYFNTSDGVSDIGDNIDVVSGGDAHLNWEFTQPGIYTMTLEASAVLTDGNVPTSSDPFTYTFEVVPEPSTWALVCAGIIALLLWRKPGGRASKSSAN